MNEIEYYLRTLHPKTWDNDLNQLTKVITVLATYTTYYNNYYIVANELGRYLYLMDHPVSITNAYTPDLEKRYQMALDVLSKPGRKESLDYNQRYNITVSLIITRLKEITSNVYATI